MAERINILETEYPIDRSNWIDVFSATLGPMWCIQNAFGESVAKNKEWTVEFEKKTLTLGEDCYPIQFIGNESKERKNWLWGWKNISHFDDDLLRLANETKEWGEKAHLEPLTEECFLLNEYFGGHTLSMVTCGISKKKYAYYACPHEKGAAFVAVSGLPEEIFAPINPQQFADVTTKALKTFVFNHVIFVESLLKWNGADYHWEGNDILARFEDLIHISFEDFADGKRIKRIKSVRLGKNNR